MIYDSSQKPSKEVVMANVYIVCKDLGLYCDLEYKIGNQTLHAVVVDGEDIIAIVMYGPSYERIRIKPNNLGVPVLLVYSVWDMKVLKRGLGWMAHEYASLCRSRDCGNPDQRRTIANEYRQVMDSKKKELIDLALLVHPAYMRVGKNRFQSLIDLANKIGYEKVQSLIAASAKSDGTDDVGMDWLFNRVQQMLKGS